MKIEIKQLNNETSYGYSKVICFYSRLIKETFIQNNLCDLEDEISKSILEKEFIIKKALESKKPYNLLIALHSNRVVGAITSSIPNDIIKSCDVNAKVEVGSIYIDKQFRGQHLASKLINSMSILLKKQGYSEFYLDSGFKSSMEIWRQKFGEPTFFFENYWSDNNHHMCWKVII